MELYLRDVCKTYKGRNAGHDSTASFCMKNVNFDFLPGKVTLVTGCSGSGKSTLLSILCGLLRPDSGKVFYGGDSIYDLGGHGLALLRNAKFGIVPQKCLLMSSLTVRENVMLPALYAGKNEKKVADKCGDLLSCLDIGSLSGRYPGELSGGEMRRVCIARAVINEPEYIFADEPTNDLDENGKKRVLSLLRESARLGAGVLIVSHDPYAVSYADIKYGMNGGRLL